jgi:hypothetical protein
MNSMYLPRIGIVKHFRQRVIPLLFLGAGTLCASEFNPVDYLAHIKFLASPELKGRRTGSPELEKAAEYIASQFRAAGLKPIAGSYQQEFDVTARIGLGPDNRLSISEGAKRLELKEGVDFAPLNLSTNGSANGAIVFAGYGITAPEPSITTTTMKASRYAEKSC